MRGMVVGRGGGILMEVVLVVVVMLILPSGRDLVWRSCVTHVATAAPVPLHSRSFVWMDISVIVIHVHTPFFWYLVINITKNHFIFLSYENFTVNRHEAILFTTPTYFPVFPELCILVVLFSATLLTALNFSSSSPSPFSNEMCCLYWSLLSISLANLSASSSRFLNSFVSLFSRGVLQQQQSFQEFLQNQNQ